MRSVLRRLVELRNAAEKSRKRGKYKKRRLKDPERSVWAEFLKNPEVQDPSTREGKLFRRRFRVPYPLFEKIVAELEELPDFRDRTDALDRASAPLTLKVLASLRVLGRGECFDTCSELTQISDTTLRTFFHQFTSFYAPKFNVWCAAPTTEADLERVTEQYRLLGFPGCVGSVDCVHLHWERCPATVANEHTGKEGYPTVVYEVSLAAAECTN